MYPAGSTDGLHSPALSEHSPLKWIKSPPLPIPLPAAHEEIPPLSLSARLSARGINEFVKNRMAFDSPPSISRTLSVRDDPPKVILMDTERLLETLRTVKADNPDTMDRLLTQTIPFLFTPGQLALTPPHHFLFKKIICSDPKHLSANLDGWFELLAYAGKKVDGAYLNYVCIEIYRQIYHLNHPPKFNNALRDFSDCLINLNQEDFSFVFTLSHKLSPNEITTYQELIDQIEELPAFQIPYNAQLHYRAFEILRLIAPQSKALVLVSFLLRFLAPSHQLHMSQASFLKISHVFTADLDTLEMGLRWITDKWVLVPPLDWLDCLLKADPDPWHAIFYRAFLTLPFPTICFDEDELLNCIPSAYFHSTTGKIPSIHQLNLFCKGLEIFSDLTYKMNRDKPIYPGIRGFIIRQMDTILLYYLQHNNNTPISNSVISLLYYSTSHETIRFFPTFLGVLLKKFDQNPRKRQFLLGMAVLAQDNRPLFMNVTVPMAGELLLLDKSTLFEKEKAAFEAAIWSNIFFYKKHQQQTSQGVDQNRAHPSSQVASEGSDPTDRQRP